jgi:hypothetical protein
MSVSSRALEVVQPLLTGSRLHGPALEGGEVAVHRAPRPRLLLAQRRDPRIDRCSIIAFGSLEMFQGFRDQPRVPIDLDHLFQDRVFELVFRQAIGTAVARSVAIARRTRVVEARSALSRSPYEGAPALAAADDARQQVVGGVSSPQRLRLAALLQDSLRGRERLLLD